MISGFSISSSSFFSIIFISFFLFVLTTLKILNFPFLSTNQQISFFYGLRNYVFCNNGEVVMVSNIHQSRLECCKQTEHDFVKHFFSLFFNLLKFLHCGNHNFDKKSVEQQGKYFIKTIILIILNTSRSTFNASRYQTSFHLQ